MGVILPAFAVFWVFWLLGRTEGAGRPYGWYRPAAAEGFSGGSGLSARLTPPAPAGFPDATRDVVPRQHKSRRKPHQKCLSSQMIQASATGKSVQGGRFENLLNHLARPVEEIPTQGSQRSQSLIQLFNGMPSRHGTQRRQVSSEVQLRDG